MKKFRASCSALGSAHELFAPTYRKAVRDAAWLFCGEWCDLNNVEKERTTVVIPTFIVTWIGE